MLKAKSYSFDVSLILAIPWIAGFVIAKGFWSTLFCLFPPWAFYLVIEHTMKYFNFI
jgi:hypothetical protein